MPKHEFKPGDRVRCPTFGNRTGVIAAVLDDGAEVRFHELDSATGKKLLRYIRFSNLRAK